MQASKSDDVIRVLHMIGSLEIGGSQMMIINIYKAIDRKKIQFDFVIDHSEARALASEVEALGARVYTMPQFKGYNIMEVRKAWDQFFEEHPEYKILHSHVRSYASLYLPVAKKHGIKTIIHSHSTSNGSGFPALVKKILQFPLRYQADYYFACSAEAGEWLFGRKVINGKRYKTIYNAIDVDKFRFDLLKRRCYRKQLKIEGKIVYIHIGRLHVSKNQDFLIRVFSKIHEVQTESVLVLVGNGKLWNSIEQRIGELKLENCVLMTGERKDVPELLQAADCFLMPSLWEGFGMSAVEAQAAGLHCFVSEAVPEFADIGAGLLHRLYLYQSPEEWADEITKMKTYEHVGDAVNYAISSGYDVKHTAKNIEDIYQRLCHNTI